MKKRYESFLQHCLYFTGNSLARTVNKMAEEEFMVTGLSPSYAVMQIIVNERSGISQHELGSVMNLAPSTVTRFIDKLVNRHLIRREVNGKLTYVFATEKGQQLDNTLRRAWENLYHHYCDILGEEFARQLTADIHTANVRFEEGK